MNNRLVLIIIYAFLLLVFLCFSFLFSSADMTYGCVSLTRLDEDIKNNPNRKAFVRARRLAGNYNRTIATILFCNDTVNAGLDTVATLMGVNLCYLILGGSTEGIANIAETWGLVTSLIVLLFKIAFGEIVPKSVSKIKNYPLSQAYSLIILFFHYLFFPFTYLVSLFGRGVSLLFKQTVPEVQVEEDDLHEMVDDIEEKGGVDEDKADMLHETIRYTHTTAHEIMTPRVDVFAIDIDDDLQEIIKDHRLYQHGRIPVYQETIDNVLGYIQVKTLIKEVLSGEEFTIADLLVEPLRFPDTAEINDIMRDFKHTKKQLALIMDEYGGLDGIVTMEDILEEIVGEIYDEKDKHQEPIVERKDGSYIVDGSVSLEDYCDLFGIDFESVNSEYVTVGGLVIELLDDHFAKVGDEADFQNTHIKVIALEDNGSVNRILVTRIEDNEEE